MAPRADSPAVDAELATLARRAAGAPEGAREPKALCKTALMAWIRGDRTGAREWLELARLRGGQNLDPLIDALQDDGRGIEGLPEAWREALRALPAR